MDGCDEDEHDEGAHQVGLEHLVSHLGVLHREKGEEEEEGGGRGGEGQMEKQVFRQTERTERTELHLKHTDTLPQMHATGQTQALERDRSRWVSCGVLGKVQSSQAQS